MSAKPVFFTELQDWKMGPERAEFSLLQLDSRNFGFQFRLATPEGLSWPKKIYGRKRKDHLWTDTCFEIFFGFKGNRYVETNFSPSGAWQTYEFSLYRDRDHTHPPYFSRIQHQARRTDRGIICTGEWTWAEHVHLQQIIQINPTVVLKSKSGAVNYLAAKPSESEADFHSRENWCSCAL